MNREIKFRAWDSSFNKIIDEENRDYHIYLDGCLSDCMDTNLFQSEYILMQFTGLKDKNGKEIYEGDLVCIDGIYIGVVKFDDAAYYFKSNQDTINNCWLHMFVSDVSYEVIGNIYENPELLEEVR